MKIWIAILGIGALVGVAILFPVGSRVAVVNGCANVRATSAGNSTVLGQQCTGTLGTVVASEVRAGGADTLSRANINFDTGVDGWTWVYYLKAVTPPPVGDTLKATLQPSTLDFGSQAVGTVSASKTASLTNNGTTTLTFPGGSSMLDTVNFRWVADDCVPSVAPGASCPFQYVFQPKSAGTFNGDNKIITSRGTVRLLLTGVGTVTTPPPPSALPNVLQVVPAALSPMTGLIYPSGAGGTVYCRMVEHPFYAILRDSTGAAYRVNATWTSSDTTIATIDASGIGHFHAPGTAVITATAGALTAQSIITVTTQPVTQVSVFIPFGIGTQQWWTGLHEREAFDSLGRHTAHLVVCVLAP